MRSRLPSLNSKKIWKQRIRKRKKNLMKKNQVKINQRRRINEFFQ